MKGAWERLVLRSLRRLRETPSGTATAAAHATDFAAAAHLTRTFSQMFGIPPSVMLRGDFFEIPSPFALET